MPGRHRKHNDFHTQPCRYLGHDWQTTVSTTYRVCIRCHTAIRWEKRFAAWVKVNTHARTQRHAQTQQPQTWEAAYDQATLNSTERTEA